MFLRDKLPVAPQGEATTPPPAERREIHIHIDWATQPHPTLRVEPRGLLEREAVNEIIDVLGFPLRASNAGLRGSADCVAVAASVAERHGWVTVESWIDAEKHLHVRMAKEVARGV